MGTKLETRNITARQNTAFSTTIIPPAGYRLAHLHIVDNIGIETEIDVLPAQELSYLLNMPLPPKLIDACVLLNQYTITVIAGAGGTTNKTGANIVIYNTNFSFTVTPQAGYEIDTVTPSSGPALSVTNRAGQTFTVNNVAANMSIAVSFRTLPALTATVTVATAGGTTNRTGSNSVPYNTNFTFTVTPQSGYEIDTVNTSLGALGISNRAGQTFTVFNVIANLSVVVSFRLLAPPPPVISYAPLFINAIGAAISMSSTGLYIDKGTYVSTVLNKIITSGSFNINRKLLSSQGAIEFGIGGAGLNPRIDYRLDWGTLKIHCFSGLYDTWQSGYSAPAFTEFVQIYNNGSLVYTSPNFTRLNGGVTLTLNPNGTVSISCSSLGGINYTTPFAVSNIPTSNIFIYKINQAQNLQVDINAFTYYPDGINGNWQP
jgi:hypothetical protein